MTAISNDISLKLADSAKNAFDTQTALRITAGNSKSFYGNEVRGEPLDVAEHQGIIDYQPSELVLTARSGTPLKEIEQTLTENRQMLAFEPPIHSDKTTYGGVIACGMNGPRRAYTGAARDFVLGTQIINGRGEILKFGGQVMKNVAGYDASRLMVGAQGTLGILLDISIKVLPMAESEITICIEMGEDDALKSLTTWKKQGIAISASCYHEDKLHIRISSTEKDVKRCKSIIGGDVTDDQIWKSLRHQTHPFFKKDNLWRVSIPPGVSSLRNMDQMIEWGGALRWISTDEPLYDTARDLGGHATRYAINSILSEDCFQPLVPSLKNLSRRIKQSFDPKNILNPGRLYSDL